MQLGLQRCASQLDCGLAALINTIDMSEKPAHFDHTLRKPLRDLLSRDAHGVAAVAPPPCGGATQPAGTSSGNGLRGGTP
jgi:hypothetical protein